MPNPAGIPEVGDLDGNYVGLLLLWLGLLIKRDSGYFALK